MARVAEFASEHGFRVHVGKGFVRANALDNGNADLSRLLGENRWDVIETLCWANAATNATLLDSIGPATLVYTPHDQPSWTVPMGAGQAEFTENVHRRTIERADLVLCDSPWERLEVQRRAPHRSNCTYVPLGCDFRTHRPGPPVRKPQFLFVGDLAEPRKRFDRVLVALELILKGWPEFRLVVIGNKTDSAIDLIPDRLRHAVELRGYVSEAELREAYAESFALILLSEFEAFGIPILEALASGTPVFLSKLEATESLFSGFKGAHFCPAERIWETAHIIEHEVERNRASIADAVSDRRRLQSIFDWDLLAERKWRAMSAAWYRRNAWSWTA